MDIDRFLPFKRWQIVTVFILITFVSCSKKEPESQVKYSYLNATLKSDYSFREGSYWVYRDQSMNTDSIRLSKYETGFTLACPRNQCPIYEFITLTFDDLTRGITFNHYLLADFIRYNGGGNWGQNGQPIFVLNDNEGFAFNGLMVGERLDSMVVMGNTFYDVKKMSVLADLQFQHEFDYNVDFYFAPATGVIKFVEYDTVNGTKTWELKNYFLAPER